MMSEAGFKLQTFDYQIKTTPFSTEGVKSFMQSWLPHLSVLAPDLHQDFLADIVTSLSKKVKVDTDGIHVPFHTLNVNAQRPALVTSLEGSSSAVRYWNSPPAQGTRSITQSRQQQGELLEMEERAAKRICS